MPTVLNAWVATQHLEHGIAHFRRNEFAAAIAEFDVALRLNPDDLYARWNRATALLSTGDYATGFPEHDWAMARLFAWRDSGPVGEDIDRLQALPLWRGEPDVRVLLYHQLGFGDAIMAFRYLPEMCRRAKITLVLDECLVRLLARFTAPCAVEAALRVPTDLTPFSARLPLFSAMSMLRQTVETIPAAPYIDRPWLFSGGKVGITWSGRTQTAFTLPYFLSMFAHRKFSVYSLQPGPVVEGVQPLGKACDFADVADRIAKMDHIVSVDTAAAHLAGAMGHPSTHLLLPFLSDWRWWHTAAWYPALKTYRQASADSWVEPFARLNDRLQSG